MRNKVLLFFIIAASLALAVRAQTAPETEAQQGYLIGPGDELTAKVLG